MTLPATWRKAVGTEHIIVRTKGDALEIRPMYIPPEEADETTVFDALRDNNGKPISPQTIIDMIKRIELKK